METVEYQGGFVWAGIPSTWPPLTITDYVVGELISRALKGVLSDSKDKMWVTAKQKNKTPTKNVYGSLYKDSGLPTRWCWWK